MRILTLLTLFCFPAFSIHAQMEAHFFRVLEDPKAALQCRIDLIQQAEHEILLSYYILKDDLTGKTLLSLLAEAAAQRGVVVRILMDRTGSKLSAPMRAFLKKNRVEVHRFFLKKKPLKKFYHHLHEKIFIVDNCVLMVGGRNLKDSYYGLGKDFNFFDYDVLATGDTLLRDARLHFYTSWDDERLSSPYSAPHVTEKEAAEYLKTIESATATVQQKLGIQFNTKADWRTGCQAISAHAGFIHDNFFTKKGSQYVPSDEKDLRSTHALIAFVDSAQHSILIKNPYFIPTKAWDRALRNALRRGVRVRLTTNSIQSNDLPIRQAAYLNRRKKMLRRGLEIWEVQGPEKLHAKVLVVDQALVAIGSYNIHRPSERYNTEVAIWIQDAPTAQLQMNRMKKNLENALQIGPNNRAIPKPGQHFNQPSFCLRAKTFMLRHTIARAFGWLM